MLDINVNELNNEIMILSKLIKDYEEIQLNLFNQLKDSCINWHDGNSINFENEINMDKRETDLYLLSLKNKKEVFDYIYTKYKEIGNKLKCDLNNKENLLETINDCQNKASDLISSLNSIDTSFSYSELSSILNQKSVATNIKKELEILRTEVSNFLNKVESIEIEIAQKIDKLEEIKINDFDFYLGE